jgi:hypothetical protein
MQFSFQTVQFRSNVLFLLTCKLLLLLLLCPVNSIYFDLSTAFDLISHPIVLHKLCAYELSDGYINWFHSYLSNWQSSVLISDTFRYISTFFGGPTMICFRILVFYIFIKELRKVIEHSKYLLFADDIKIFHAMYSAYNCFLLQSDIEHIQGWCTAEFFELDSKKTEDIPFTRKTNFRYYDYKLSDYSITHTNTIKVFGADSKLYLHFLPLRKDVGLNTNYNALLFCS